MEYEKIKQLIDDMGNSKLSSISIDFPDGTKIIMAKEEKILVTQAQGSMLEQEIAQESTVKQEVEQGKIKVQSQQQEKVNENIETVKSPMVGTFYLKPSPSASAYVEIGKEVKVGDTLCIIEAMKLMNEIESEYTGKISKILVEDGKAVEYGTPLFEIEI